MRRLALFMVGVVLGAGSAVGLDAATRAHAESNCYRTGVGTRLGQEICSDWHRAYVDCKSTVFLFAYVSGKGDLVEGGKSSSYICPSGFVVTRIS